MSETKKTTPRKPSKKETTIAPTALSLESVASLVKDSNKDSESPFGELTSIDAKLAKVLARWKGSKLSLDGLSSLSPEAMTALAKWRGHWKAKIQDWRWMDLTLSLNGLQTLDAALATALASWVGCNLSLAGVNLSDKETARIMATFQGGKLHLGHISAEAANELLSWRGNSSLTIAQTTLDAPTAQALAKRSGYLLGLKITSLSKEVATNLSACRSDSLVLTELSDLSDEAALALSQNLRCTLDLPRLSSLSILAAKGLAKGHGEFLQLNGLKEISDEAMSALCAWEGRVLDLSGLSVMRLALAEPIAQRYHRGGRIKLHYSIRQIMDAPSAALLTTLDVWG